jgi:hypothetical protein
MSNEQETHICKWCKAETWQSDDECYANPKNKQMKNNKQQTAVDILCGKLAMKLGIPQAITFYIDHQEEIREAKEMEKERMIEFAQLYAVIHCMGDITKNAEEYYNETYGGGEQ